MNMDEDSESKHSLQAFKLRQMVAKLRDTTAELEQKLQGMKLKADEFQDELASQSQKSSKKSKTQVFTEESRIQKLQEKLNAVTSERESFKHEIQCLKLQISESDERISELNAVNNALMLELECKSDKSYTTSVDRKPSSTSIKNGMFVNNKKISDMLGPDYADDIEWFIISKNSEIICLEFKIKVCECDIAYKEEELCEALRQIESVTAENIILSNNLNGSQNIVNELFTLIRDIMAFLSKFYPYSNGQASDELQNELDNMRALNLKQQNEIAKLKKALDDQQLRSRTQATSQTPELLSRCLQHLRMEFEKK